MGHSDQITKMIEMEINVAVAIQKLAIRKSTRFCLISNLSVSYIVASSPLKVAMDPYDSGGISSHSSSKARYSGLRLR